MTNLTVSIMVEGVEDALARAREAAAQGADLVEYRLDRFTDSRHAAAELVGRTPLQCIVTCRPTWEGGEYTGGELARLSVFEAACSGDTRPAYLDVELTAYQRRDDVRRRIGALVAHPGQTDRTPTKLILSSHDFTGYPADLTQRLEAMEAAPACAVMKVAWLARSIGDNLAAFDVLGHARKPTVALCMGPFGLPSRVLAKKYGAFLTFASLGESDATAPGQPTLRELKTLYRWDRLNAQTQVFGVVGHPVGHSMSPAVHNAGFEAAGQNAVYLLLPIEPGYESFVHALDGWASADLDPPLGFVGASLTIPHKENLLRWARSRGGEVDASTDRIGAGNTLTVTADGSIRVANTDAEAAVDAVCDAMEITKGELCGKRVAVIGAGGVARAVVVAFAECGATVVVYNRTHSRAEALVDDVNTALSSGAGGRDDRIGPRSAGKVVAARLEKLCGSCCHIFINCTPLGMAPDADTTPVPADRGVSAWGPGTVVFDTVYNPPITRMLREARAAGCTTISGVEMFVRQAARQFSLWCPTAELSEVLDLYREIVSDRLCLGR